MKDKVPDKSGNYGLRVAKVASKHNFEFLIIFFNFIF
jgi:hypothetical protein